MGPIPNTNGSGSWAFDFENPVKVLAAMNLMGITPTLGLQNNTLCDVISDNNGHGDTLINALSFEVSCGTLQNMTTSWIEPSATIGRYCHSLGKYINLE